MEAINFRVLNYARCGGEFADSAMQSESREREIKPNIKHANGNLHKDPFFRINCEHIIPSPDLSLKL